MFENKFFNQDGSTEDLRIVKNQASELMSELSHQDMNKAQQQYEDMLRTWSKPFRKKSQVMADKKMEQQEKMKKAKLLDNENYSPRLRQINKSILLKAGSDQPNDQSVVPLAT